MARKSESNWVRQFEVTSPTRHKKFTVYKVTSKVFPKFCPEGVTVITVWKRYNDFKKLYKEMTVIHRDLHLTGEFPKFPKAKMFGRFDYEIVEERRKAARELLDFAANHSPLFTHKTFVHFFEHGYKVKDNASTENANKVGGSSNDSCLIPEKVWSDVHAGLNDDADELSISSLESSSAGTTTFTTDSDSVLSNSVLSDTINLIHPSFTLDFGSLAGVASSSIKPSFLASGRYEIDSGLNSDMTPAPSDSLIEDSYTETRSSSSFSGVSSSKSCPSLDKLPSTSTSNSAQQQQTAQKANALRRSLKYSWGLSMKRKSSNGLSGFFDFLPIFPKKAEEKKLSDEKLLADSLTASYICEAACHFAVAQQHESNGELSTALESYKEGIRLLLQGGQSDKDAKRRIIVRTKVEKYLSKAEALHSSLQSSEKSACNPSKTPLFSPKKVQSFLPLRSSSLDGPNANDYMKPSSLEDLRNYKVVGVAAPGVLVVVNVDTEKNGPKCYAIKVLRKSSSPLMPQNKTIIATQVPFMVKLVKWFNTENTIIHLLQYAGGGKLSDFVHNYQTKQISIIPHDISPCDNTDEKESVDDSSLAERKSAMTVLAAFAEQMENKLIDMNGNLDNNEQGGLCPSYARLFQESDSEESSNEGKQLKTNVGSNTTVKADVVMRMEEIEESKGQRKGKTKKKSQLAVDSSQYESKEDINEILEVESGSTVTATIEGKVTEKNVKMVKEASSSSSPLFSSGVVENDGVISWSNLDGIDTSDLIASSKVLIQTVSRTLTQCDTATNSTIVGGSSSGNHELESKDSNGDQRKNKKKKKEKEKNDRLIPPLETCSSRDYDDYNNGTGSVNGSSDGESDAMSNHRSFLSSPDSLSLSLGKQKPIETNESENNNNKEWRNGANLMSGESVRESKSQCIKFGMNQKPTTMTTTTLATTRDDVGGGEEEEEEAEDKGWDRTDCYSSNDKSKLEMSTDELLGGEISDETKLKDEEGSPVASRYCQPFHNSDSNENLCDPLPIQRMVPECCVKVWMAEIVLALEKLHSIGLTYGDLGMRNILLGESGHILLSFTSQWTDVDYVPRFSEWIAPEARNSFESSLGKQLHFSVDFWSLGAILFYLLTGRTVESCHPEGTHANTSLKILDTNLCGEYISPHAKSLMTELLQINPNLRLGYYGAEEIKNHPFFDGFDWDKALEETLEV